MSEEPPAETSGRIYTHSIRVDAACIDENRHANNVVYLQWMNEASLLHFETIGGPALMSESGVTWVARAHQIEYLRPVYQDDELLLKTWVSTVEKVKSRRCYEFLVEGSLVARGETEWVCVDIRSGRPRKIPGEVVEMINHVLSDEGESR